MRNDSYNPPKAKPADHLHSIIRAGMSAVPVFGGPGVELFNVLVTPSLEKRRQEWMDAVAEGLKKLEDAHESIIDELKTDE